MIPLLILVSIALLLNKGDIRMLILALVVGINVLTPLDSITDCNVWYATCIFMELITLMAAARLNTAVSMYVVCLSGLLVWCHIVAWKFTGQAPESVYRTVAPMLEYLNVLSLSLFSQPILNFLKERIKQCLQLKP